MSKFRIILAMIIFGTIGVFVSAISFPSEFIALVRAFVGTVVIALFFMITKKKPNFESIKRNLPHLLPLGVLLGLNWVFLFEAYRFTGVSIGTLCYYMAPVFVIILSPVVLKRRTSLFKALISLVAVVGIILITGVEKSANPRGVLFGLLAALAYAFIIMLNTRLREISSLDTTLCQLGVSSVVLLIYFIVNNYGFDFTFDTKSVIILLVLGTLHTGIAYLIYFGAINKLPPEESAIYGYVDPLVALVLSTALLGEPITLVKIIGALFIFASTIVYDLKKE